MACDLHFSTGTSGPCVGNIGPIERLNFTGLCLQDGPLAIRQAIYVDVFPAGLSAAASWDRPLVRQRGAYMGAEFKAKGSHVALGVRFRRFHRFHASADASACRWPLG